MLLKNTDSISSIISKYFIAEDVIVLQLSSRYFIFQLFRGMMRLVERNEIHLDEKHEQTSM